MVGSLLERMAEREGLNPLDLIIGVDQLRASVLEGGD
jgi:hypothetical protein